MRRRVMALILAGTVAACSYIIELPDQQLPGADASVDAQPDGAAIADASTASFCSGQASPLFCEDFDGPTEPALGSLGTLKTKDGQVLVENAVALSPRRALLTTVSGTGSSAALTRTLEGTPNGVTLSFDLLVSTWQTPRAQLAQIEIEDGGSTCVVRLVGDGAKLSLLQECGGDAGGASVPTATARDVETGRWRRFSLSVELDPKPAIRFTIDGATVVDGPGLPAMRAGRTSVSIGIDVATSGTAVLFQDNVLVTSP